MNAIRPRPREALVAAIGFLGFAGATSGAVTDIIGSLPSTEFNNDIASNTYADWGNEPFIAVNPANPSQVVVSSFAFSFINGGGDASLWVSNNGGSSWDIRFPVNSVPALSSPPANSSGPSGPNDQTFVYDSGGTLHGVMLTSYTNNTTGNDAALNVYHGTTTNPSTTGSFNWNSAPVSAGATGTQADQPWMTISGSKVFAGYDVFNSNGTVSQRVNLSANGGSTFTQDLLVGKTAGGFTNPGLRLASDANGNAYAVWGVGTGNISANAQSVTYHLNRYSGGASWDYTNNSTSDGAGGLVIDSGSSSQIGSTPSAYFGGKNQLLGNITAIASDAAGTHVYVAYGKQDVTNTDRIWLAEFHPSSGNLVERANPVALSVPAERSALPSVAVAANGTIGVMYDTSPATDQFEVHFSQSVDGGLTFVDQILYAFNTSGFTLGSSQIPSSNRILGDYQYLMASGNTFYGTFVGTGNTVIGNNTTGLIDPYFFSMAAAPEPTALAIGAPEALALLLLRRRRRHAARV